MIKILFTKAFPIEKLNQKLGSKFFIESHDFIQTTENDWSDIQKQMLVDAPNYIISSSRTAKMIKGISKSANFYVVGEKSKDILENAGYNIAYSALYADELVQFIRKKFKEQSTFNFLCSQIRRDTIPESLKEMGHTVNEIIAYCTKNKTIDLQDGFDVYVFYSPSGVKSFQEQYGIAEKARIFAIGKTTADAVEKLMGRKVEFPDRPDNDSLIQFIKTRLNAEK